jgi:hypothetical protein
MIVFSRLPQDDLLSARRHGAQPRLRVRDQYGFRSQRQGRAQTRGLCRNSNKTRRERAARPQERSMVVSPRACNKMFAIRLLAASVD